MQPFIRGPLADAPRPEQPQSQMHKGCHPSGGSRSLLAFAEASFQLCRTRAFAARTITSKRHIAVDHQALGVVPQDLMANASGQGPELPHGNSRQSLLKTLQRLAGTFPALI